MMNKIAKYLHQILGVVEPKDPEKERVVAALLERLKDHDQWIAENYQTVIHKEFNIKAWPKKIESPEKMDIPFKWRAHVQEHITIIHRINEVDTLNFVHDVISGKYVYQVKMSILHQYDEWLKENAKSDEYIIKDYWIYFLDEETAMGFKLALQ